MKSAYPIPSVALDDRLGWIGTSGSGKTYNAGAGVEQLLAAKARVVIVDPLDVWWGLRLQSDGKATGFSLPIFGGAHGDLPLNEQAGALIGETVAGMAESCIVSLGGLATKSAERRFMLAFLDALYRKASGEPVHLIFDEADLWAPQKSSEPMLQNLMEQIVRRGRIKGFIPWLITQRPAVLSKDVLSQVDGLIAFKLTSSQDRDAIGAWIEGQADRGQGRDILASLPAMERGQGVVWIPGRGVLETAQFPPKVTFDSSRTPARGERKETRALRPLNLEALKGRLANIDADAKANDPKVLKAEIARLLSEVRRLERAKADPPAPVVANQEALDEARAEGERVGIAIGITRAQQALAGLRVDQPATVTARQPGAAPVAKSVMPTPTPAAGVTAPQQRILNALAWWAAFGINRPTNEQVGFVAGYAPGSGNFNNIKGQLRSSGLIEYPAGGLVSLTPDGATKAEAPPLEVTTAAFHNQVRAKLSGPQLKLLEPALAAYPQAITTEELAAHAGYAAGSGNFNNLRGQLRTIGLIDYPSPGQVRAAAWLFPTPTDPERTS